MGESRHHCIFLLSYVECYQIAGGETSSATMLNTEEIDCCCLFSEGRIIAKRIRQEFVVTAEEGEFTTIAKGGVATQKRCQRRKCRSFCIFVKEESCQTAGQVLL